MYAMALEPTSNTISLVTIAENHATGCFTRSISPLYSMAHAAQMVDAAKIMLALHPVEPEQHDHLVAAAWMCTVGGAETHPIDRSALAVSSAEIAETVLSATGCSPADVDAVKLLILSTDGAAPPSSPAHEILHDAFTHHYAAANFRDNMKRLYKTELRLGVTQLDYVAWRMELVATLQQHQYYTVYGRTILAPKKEEHLQKIQGKVERKIAALSLEPPEDAPFAEDITDDAIAPTAPANEADFPPKSSRTIETMFRISAPNNVRVSAMADDKAQIMINVNAIILSVAFGLILKNLETHPGFAIPTAILLFVNVATIVYAVLATRPKLADGKFTQAQIDDKSVNLMFYGSFYNMSYEEYAKAVQKMMSDTTFLYNSLTKDIYWQGKVLGRKFKLLRISYTIFMYGIVVSALAFAVGVYVEFFAK